MRYIPIALKVILNFFFYIIYSIVGMLFGGWLYGLILNNKGIQIPENGDAVYFKLAIIIATIVLIKTFFFRKYFYISVSLKSKIISPENTKIHTNKAVEPEPKITERVILNPDEIEILLDKEIK